MDLAPRVETPLFTFDDCQLYQSEDTKTVLYGRATRKKAISESIAWQTGHLREFEKPIPEKATRACDAKVV